jgi:hypothetical protein
MQHCGVLRRSPIGVDRHLGRPHLRRHGQGRLDLLELYPLLPGVTGRAPSFRPRSRPGSADHTLALPQQLWGQVQSDIMQVRNLSNPPPRCSPAMRVPSSPACNRPRPMRTRRSDGLASRSPGEGGRAACSSKQLAIQSSGQIGLAIEDRERAERRPTAFRDDVVMAATTCICYGPHAPALVEGADCDVAVAQRLQCHGAEEGGFARAGRPEDQRMADVTDVQVHSERRGAGGGGIKERRRRLRVERAGVLLAACSNARQRQHVGEIGGMDQWPAHIRYRMAR